MSNTYNRIRPTYDYFIGLTHGLEGKMSDAYNPNALTERCQALRDRYFALLDRTKNMVGYDKIIAFDEIIAELEAMSTEIEYICKM